MHVVLVKKKVNIAALHQFHFLEIITTSCTVSFTCSHYSFLILKSQILKILH